MKKFLSNSKFAGLALGLVALIAITTAAGVNGVFNSVNSALGYKVAGGAGSAGQALCSDGTRFDTPCSVGGAFYQTVDSDGTPQTQRPTLDFGPEFTLTDSASPAKTIVHLTGGTDYYFSFNGCTMTITGNSFNCRATYSFASVSPVVPTQPDANYFISCNIDSGEAWGASSNVNSQTTTDFDLVQNVDRFNGVTATVTPVIWCHLHHN